MTKFSPVLVLAIMVGSAFAKEPLTIDPQKIPDGSSATATFEGKIDAHDVAHVWIVVHPEATNVCWVQPEATISKNTWTAVVHMGEQSDTDVFEIRAVANPQTPMKTGMQIACWPKAQYISDIVRITRK